MDNNRLKIIEVDDSAYDQIVEDLKNLKGFFRLEKLFNYINKNNYFSEVKLFLGNKIEEGYSVVEISGINPPETDKKICFISKYPYPNQKKDTLQNILDEQSDNILFDIILHGCNALVKNPK